MSTNSGSMDFTRSPPTSPVPSDGQFSRRSSISSNDSPSSRRSSISRTSSIYSDTLSTSPMRSSTPTEFDLEVVTIHRSLLPPTLQPISESIDPEVAISGIRTEIERLGIDEKIKPLDEKLKECCDKKKVISRKIIHSTDPSYKAGILQAIAEVKNAPYEYVTGLINGSDLSNKKTIIVKIKESNPTDVDLSQTSEELLESGNSLIVELEKVLRNECELLNERANLLGQKAIAPEEIEKYIDSAISKEREHLKLRIMLFPPKSERLSDVEDINKLYLKLLKGGITTFDHLIQAISENHDTNSTYKSNITEPLSVLVKNARHSEKDKELLRLLIKHALGRVTSLSWEECPLNELQFAAEAIAVLGNAMRSASRDVVNAKKDSMGSLEWERWAKELWDSTSDESVSFALMVTEMTLQSKKTASLGDDELFKQKIERYPPILGNLTNLYFVGAPTLQTPYALREEKGKELWNSKEYVTQLTELIKDSQIDSFEKLSADQKALDKELTNLYINAIKKVRDDVTMDQLWTDYSNEVLVIHAAMEKNYQRLQKCRHLESVSPPPKLENLLSTGKKSLFSAYVKYSIESFVESEGNKSTHFNNALEFMIQQLDSPVELFELYDILRNSILKMPDEHDYRSVLQKKVQQFDLLVKELKEAELEDWNKTLSNLTKSKASEGKLYYQSSSRSLYSLTDELKDKKRTPVEKLGQHANRFQRELLVHFRIARLQSLGSKTSGELQHPEAFITKVVEFEKAKAWKYLNDPHSEMAKKDQLMEGILKKGSSQLVASWIEKRDFKNLDHLVDYAIGQVSHTADGELDLSKLQAVIRAGVNSALQGRLHRGERIKTIREMVKHIEERANIEKWKYIDDPSYGGIFDAVIKSVKEGIADAFPNPQKRSQIAARIFG